MTIKANNTNRTTPITCFSVSASIEDNPPIRETIPIKAIPVANASINRLWTVRCKTMDPARNKTATNMKNAVPGSASWNIAAPNKPKVSNVPINTTYSNARIPK
ncbi:hypothetical protein D3C71_1068150 [compost metagenome]